MKNLRVSRRVYTIGSVWGVLFCLFTGVFFNIVVQGEQLAGSISGTISHPIADLVVMATTADEKQTVHTKVDSKTGEYEIGGLAPGIYMLSVVCPGAFGLVGIDLGVELSELDAGTEGQVMAVLESFDRAYERGDFNALSDILTEGCLGANIIIDKVNSTTSRQMKSKKILIQKGDASSVTIIRRCVSKWTRAISRSGKGDKDLIDQVVHFQKIGGQWKITKIRREGYLGPIDEWIPEPYIMPYVEYIINPNLTRIEVEAGETTSGHNYTLPPEAIRMSELKTEILLQSGEENQQQ